VFKVEDSGKADELKRAIIEGDEERARVLSEELLRLGLDPLKAVEECIYPAVAVVGERFERGEYFLTELMLSAEAMKVAVDVFTKSMSVRDEGLLTSKMGVVVVGTVKGDVHEIGKNLVSTLLRVNGFHVEDLGKDVAPEEFLKKAEEVKADIIALSALMTNTMQSQRETIRHLIEMGVRSRYKVLVGGAPTSQEWADQIGADGWAPDAPSAVAVARRVLGKDDHLEAQTNRSK